MATPTALNLIEECKISPPPGSVPPTSLPLTVIDTIWFGQPTVQRLLFYEFLHPTTYFLEKLLPDIKTSLSLTLQHFFPLAGNLAWPQGSSLPEIQYVDGDFLLLTVAESDYGNFSTLRENQPKDVSSLYPLAPKLLDRSNDKLLPLMALQVTLFPNQGICIGITYNHLVADGRAIHHFIKSWASICKHHGIDDEYLLPSHDKSFLIRKSSDTYIANYLKKRNITSDTFHLPKDSSSLNSIVFPIDEKVLATFVMRPPAIKRLRQWVQSQTRNESLHLSTFVLTCAYVWVCLIKARCGEGVAEEESKEEFEFVISSADGRSLLDPPLPRTFFGNCLTVFFATTKRSELTRKDGMLIAAELIGNAIQKIEKGDAIFRVFESFLSSSDTISNFDQDRVFSVAGSPKFGIYETDFGWGNPKKSEVISIADTGAISLTECPAEVGGVEVGLVRKFSEMNAFTSLFANTIEDLPC